MFHHIRVIQRCGAGRLLAVLIHVLRRLAGAGHLLGFARPEIWIWCPFLKRCTTATHQYTPWSLPAFVSQFFQKVRPEKLRSAFKKLGFEGRVKVAFFTGTVPAAKQGVFILLFALATVSIRPILMHCRACSKHVHINIWCCFDEPFLKIGKKHWKVE